MDKKLQPIRILRLDRPIEAISVAMQQTGVPHMLVYPGLWRNLQDPYNQLPPETEKVLRQITENEIDLVMLGNNLGAGLVWGRCITPAMKKRTYVLWHDQKFTFRHEYTELGFSKFATRAEFPTIFSTTFRHFTGAS